MTALAPIADKALKVKAPRLPKPDHSTVVHVDPLTVLPSNLVRYGLLPIKVQAMSDSILESTKAGGPGIHSPVEISALDAETAKAHPGYLWRMETGDYRRAGLIDANKRHKLGLELPAFVVPSVDTKERIARQLSENQDRQDMTYMDIARAIDNMTKAGFTRQEIREAFPRTTEGKMKEASNSWINVVHSFLQFPEEIRVMIENGEILYEAAYALTLKPADKHAAIIQTIKDARAKAIADEAKREAAFLDSEKKRISKEEKETARGKELAEAEALVEQSGNALAAATETFNAAAALAAEAYKIMKSSTGEAKAAAKDAFGVADKALTSAKAERENAEKTHTKTKTALDKVKGVVKEKTNDEQPEVAAPAPPAPAKGSTPAKTTTQKPVTGKEVNTAAAAHGAQAKAKPFTAAEMKKIVESIKYLSDPNTQKNAHLLGQLLIDAFNGTLGTFESGVDAQVQQAVVTLTGGKLKK